MDKKIQDIEKKLSTIQDVEILPSFMYEILENPRIEDSASYQQGYKPYGK